jgi:hypothetical protein
MGDHRADVKITFKFHGQTYEMDSWINWSGHGSECDGVDQRVIDFFRASTKDGLARYHAAADKAYAIAHAADIEASERREFERLREKFGGTT